MTYYSFLFLQGCTWLPVLILFLRLYLIKHWCPSILPPALLRATRSARTTLKDVWHPACSATSVLQVFQEAFKDLCSGGTHIGWLISVKSKFPIFMKAYIQEMWRCTYPSSQRGRVFILNIAFCLLHKYILFCKGNSHLSRAPIKYYTVKLMKKCPTKWVWRLEACKLCCFHQEYIKSTINDSITNAPRT